MAMNGRRGVNESGSEQVATGNLISVSEASRKGIFWPEHRAESGQDTVIFRNGKPATAVVGACTMRRLAYAEELELKRAQLTELFEDTAVR